MVKAYPAEQDLFDAIVVGAGPAGLSAALVLGRCRRRVLVLDDGKPRNSASHAMHGFLSRDGTAPSDFLSISREQLLSYPSVTILKLRAVDASRDGTGFFVHTSDGPSFRARKLLLATGVVDHLPSQPGFQELYGLAVFVCPYCDGWELRDQPLAVYGKGDDKGAGLALEMTLWSSNIVLCTDGPSELSTQGLRRLAEHGISVREEKIICLQGDGQIPHNAPFDVVFEFGPTLRRTGLFFNTGRHQASDLAARLGCDTFEAKGCTVDSKQMTHVPGLYVAGDASRDVLQVIVAAAEGAQAAIAINTALLDQDLG
jgi:thioredoxin reductase